MAKTTSGLILILALCISANAQQLCSKFAGPNHPQGYPALWPVHSVEVGTNTAILSGFDTNWTEAQMNLHMAPMQAAVISNQLAVIQAQQQFLQTNIDAFRQGFKRMKAWDDFMSVSNITQAQAAQIINLHNKAFVQLAPLLKGMYQGQQDTDP